MRRITSLFFFLSFVVLTCKSQAHLGATISEIRNDHPDNYFKLEYTKDGTKYYYTEMLLGTFCYYFNDEGRTYMCMQIPGNMTKLNTQVEIYNKKYVVTSEKSWKAYLEGGAIMYIRLTFNEQYQLYSFIYTNSNE